MKRVGHHPQLLETLRLLVTTVEAARWAPDTEVVDVRGVEGVDGSEGEVDDDELGQT
jgi:hypothetical protein